MAKRRLALESGGRKLLELHWQRGLRDFRVSVPGRAWTLDPSVVLAGTLLTLPDGSSLFIRIVKRCLWSGVFRDELLVARDGVPLPGSDGSPRLIAKRAMRMLVLFAFLRILFATLLTMLQRPGAGGPNLGLMLLEGLALLVLGVLAWFGLRTPVLLGAVLLGVESTFALLRGITPSSSAILVNLTRPSRNQRGCRGSRLQTPGFRKSSSWSLGSGA
jgi:hypothetical protein